MKKNTKKQPHKGKSISGKEHIEHIKKMIREGKKIIIVPNPH